MWARARNDMIWVSILSISAGTCTYVQGFIFSRVIADPPAHTYRYMHYCTHTHACTHTRKRLQNPPPPRHLVYGYRANVLRIEFELDWWSSVVSGAVPRRIPARVGGCGCDQQLARQHLGARELKFERRRSTRMTPFDALWTTRFFSADMLSSEPGQQFALFDF